MPQGVPKISKAAMTGMLVMLVIIISFVFAIDYKRPVPPVKRHHLLAPYQKKIRIVLIPLIAPNEAVQFLSGAFASGQGVAAMTTPTHGAVGISTRG